MNSPSRWNGAKVLVIGGTRYFGKRLVQQLPDAGARMTLASRGLANDSFGDRVARARIDRGDARSLESGLGGRGEWDVVFDQICYSPDEARYTCELLKDRTARYVHTSTQSVYPESLTGLLGESLFDPSRHPLRAGARADFDYAEGKRQAEAFFFQQAPFPVAAVRLPLVLGPDDYTGRLELPIKRVLDGRSLHRWIPDLAREFSLISSREAADFLAWLGLQSHTGSVNACSVGPLTRGRLLSLVEEALGKKARYNSGTRRNSTPSAGASSRVLDTRLAEELGYRFEPVKSWLAPLIREIAARLSDKPSWIPAWLLRRLRFKKVALAGV